MIRATLPLSLILTCFLAACASKPPATAKHERVQHKMFALLQKFDRFDDNGDGYLTRKELKNGVEAAGTMLLTEDQYDRAMKAYDTNGDHKISLREAQIGADKGPEIFGVTR